MANSIHIQATGPLLDEINRKVADAIGEAIQKGADAQAAIGAAVITAFFIGHSQRPLLAVSMAYCGGRFARE